MADLFMKAWKEAYERHRSTCNLLCCRGTPVSYLEVIYAGTHPCKILSRDLNTDEVTIRFLDPGLIPQEMTVPSRMVETTKNKSTHCPKCSVQWKMTPGFSTNFYDCPKCNMKKEEAV